MDPKQDLKEFASYLITQKLDLLTSVNLELSKEQNLFVISELSKTLSETKLYDIVKRGLYKFLKSIVDGNVLEMSYSDIDRWRKNELPSINTRNIYLSDLIYLYNVRKKLFTKFIPQYTSDLNTALSILTEVDSIQAHLQEKMVEAYFSVQQEEQKKEREKLKALANASFEGIIFYKDSKILDWNLSAYEILGCTSETQLKGREILDFIPDLNRSVDKAHPFVTKLTRLNGKQAIVEYNHRHLELLQETIEILVIKDITELSEANSSLEENRIKIEKTNQQLVQVISKKEAAEKALKESEEKYRLLAEYSTDVISVHATDGVFTYVSPSSLNVFGYEPEDLIGKTPYDYILEEDIAGVKAIHELFLKITEQNTLTFRFRRKNGEYIWVETMGRSIKDPKSGSIMEIHLTTRNINERKEAEERLEKEHTYLNAILETVQEGIVACDQYGNLSFFNKAAKMFHGMPPSEDHPEVWGEKYKLYHPETNFILQKEEIPLHKAFKGEPVHNQEIIIESVTGVRRHLVCTGSQIITSDKTFHGAVVILSDITESKISENQIKEKNKALTNAYGELKKAEETLKRINSELEERVQRRTNELSEINKELKKEVAEKRRAERTLKIKNRELQRTNTDLDNFIYTASHDLKSPVSNLEALLTELKGEFWNEIPSDSKLLLTFIEQSVLRLKNTIADLTEISRIQRGTEEDIAEVSLFEIMDDVKIENKDLLKSTGAVVEVNFEEAEKIRFSKKHLRSIFYNLFNNALKYRSYDRSPYIKIRTSRKSRFLLLSIEDNGIGIPPDNLNKIFGMFKRLHDHVEGTGIGLYIVKRIMDNNGGRIDVTSKLGEGTRFDLYFRQ